MNKRGQELSVTTIILIVIGLLVLVLLIIGFTIGWKKIFPWIKPTNNVKDIADQCKISCSINSKYDFCTVKRELRAEDITLQEINCDYLAEMKQEYGVEKCASIQCDIGSFVDKTVALNKCKELLVVAGADKKDVCDNTKVQYLGELKDKIQKLEIKVCKDIPVSDKDKIC